MRLTRWLIIAIVASLLVLAACGSDDDDGDSNGVPDAPTATDSGSDAPTDEPPDNGDNGEGDGDGMSALAGEWVGSWNNDTFGSTAPITMSISVNDDGTASFTFGLSDTTEGAPFGVPGLAARTFDGTHTDAGLSVDIEGDDTFGDISVTISATGELAARATMAGVPGISGLTVEGSFDGSGMDVTYTVEFPDGSDATGTATLTRL